MNQVIEIVFQHWEIILLFFLIAVLYSSIGFGGGSSYLAVLALTSIAFVEIRATALLCNIVVVTSGTYFYAKKGYYNWKKVMPLVLFSVPMAFIGGYLKISETLFFILLGCTLLIAAIFMWMSKYISEISAKKHKNNSILKDASYGGVIGLFSGLVGIGGGIFLAPILHLTNWDTPKRIAATASFFILVNSFAGLIGQTKHPEFAINWELTSVLLGAVFIGGQIGSRISFNKFTPLLLKRMTAILIAFVGMRILWKHFI